MNAPKIAVVTVSGSHQRKWGDIFAQGLRVHGINPVMVEAWQPVDADIVCCWGWAVGRFYREKGHEVLVAERGYVGDRLHWTSLGWNGLNGHADFRNGDVAGDRWDDLFAEHMKPWRSVDEGYALLLGQVPGDQSLRGIDYQQWVRDAADGMTRTGYGVRWRPHPQCAGLGHRYLNCSAPEIGGTLKEAFEGARVAVGYNSNSTLDAVLAGVPTIVTNPGAMAWDVASHNFDGPLITPDRTEWAHRLAYCQWSPEEMSSGAAWAHIGKGA